jgi:mannose-6-phosphate isomerase-like protein (cupin superfamily)
MRYHALVLILVVILAPTILALAEDSGSDLAANSPQQEGTSGFVLINLTEDAGINPIAAGNQSSISRLIWGENLSANHVQFSPGMEIKMHYHEGIEEVMLVVGGQGIINVTGMNYTIKAGDILYLPVNMLSAMYAVGDENLELVSIYAPPSNGTRTYV